MIKLVMVINGEFHSKRPLYAHEVVRIAQANIMAWKGYSAEEAEDEAKGILAEVCDGYTIDCPCFNSAVDYVFINEAA